MKNLEELRPLLLTDFQRDLFDASLLSLIAADNPLRLTNFSAGFRELVRHVLCHLAPDDEIKLCSWYTPEQNSSTGVTRAHRVSFFIHGGIAPEFAEEMLNIDVLGERKSLIKAVDALSKFTHVNPETFNPAAGDVYAFATSACHALSGLLKAANDARAELVDAVSEYVDDEIVYAVMSETVMAVDDIASHHSIEEVDFSGVEVVRIGAKYIEFIASGTLGVELQWGSNSDLRRGDGALMRESFPLTLRLTSSVEEPTAISAVEDSLEVNTLGWHNEYLDQEDEFELQYIKDSGAELF